MIGSPESSRPARETVVELVVTLSVQNSAYHDE